MLDLIGQLHTALLQLVLEFLNFMFAVITKRSTVYDLNLPQVVSLSRSSEMANGGRPLFPGSDVDDQLRRIFKYPLLSVVHCPGIVCVVYRFSCCAVFDKGPTIFDF